MKNTESRSWDWTKVDDAYWTRPAADVYFLLHRWKQMGFTTILDIGCGLGRHSILFAELGFRVTALDLSASALEHVSKMTSDLGYEIQLSYSDLKTLPYPDHSFDAIIAYHSIYHVDSQGMLQSIAEAKRVLRPRGELYMTLISKSTSSFTDPASEVVDSNVRLKREEDGSLLPHYYVDRHDIPVLLSGMTILELKQVEDIFGDTSSWHYFVHASKGTRAT